MIIRRKPVEKKPDNIFEAIGNVNGFGIKVLEDGSQWIIDAKTGKPEKRNGYDPMRTKQGIYFWIKKGETLTSLDTPHPSIWRKE